MTKAQKSLYKQLKKPAHRAAFIQMLGTQQEALGRYSHWDQAYAKKCRKKGVENPAIKKVPPTKGGTIEAKA